MEGINGYATIEIMDSRVTTGLRLIIRFDCSHVDEDLVKKMMAIPKAVSVCGTNMSFDWGELRV